MFCNSILPTQSDLDYHTKFHENDKEDNYPCNQCDKSFQRLCNLDKHIRAHAQIKPFECHVCNKMFSDKRDLDKHTKRYVDESLNFCEICGKSFHSAKELKTHQNIFHKNEKCDICDKKFCKKQLKIHLETHIFTKSFVCEICCKTFKLRRSLIEHMNKKHELNEKFNEIFKFGNDLSAFHQSILKSCRNFNQIKNLPYTKTEIVEKLERTKSKILEDLRKESQVIEEELLCELASKPGDNVQIDKKENSLVNLQNLIKKKVISLLKSTCS